MLIHIPVNKISSLVIMRTRLNNCIKSLSELEQTFSTSTGQVDFTKMVELQEKINEQWTQMNNHIDCFKGEIK